MRNALIFKLILLGYFYLSVFNISRGQSNTLILPTEVAQLTDSWCWAACMEMIIKYHDNASTINQCSLAINYLKLDIGFDALDTDVQDAIYRLNGESSCCPICSSSTITHPLDCTKRIAYDKTIDYFDGNTTPVPHNIDLLFGALGYNSSEDLNGSYTKLDMVDGKPFEYRMPWEAVKQEIDSVGPFIIVLASPFAAVKSSSGLSGGRPEVPNNNHLVVVKGYATRSSATGDYDKISIRDPWLPLCNGHEVLIPYNVFNASAEDYSGVLPAGIIYTFNQVLAVVHSIYPKMGTIPPTPLVEKMQIAPSEPKESLLSFVNENSDRIIGARQEIYQDSTITNKITTDAYYKTEIKFISSNQIRRSPLALDNITEPHQIIEVVSIGVEPDITTTFEKIKGLWKVKQIAAFTFVKPTIEIGIKDRKLILSNIKNGTAPPNAIAYTLLKYPPFLYEFYSFNYEGKSYISPAQDYPEFKIEQGFAYNEKHILRCLRKETRRYDKPDRWFKNQLLIAEKAMSKKNKDK